MWADLPADVLIELVDPKYAHLTHHSRSTYNKGCRGPLCRKEEREDKERKRVAEATAEGRELRPYRQTPQSLGDVHRNEVLDTIHAWHRTFRTKPRELQKRDQDNAMAEWLRANARKGAEVA